MSEMEQRMQQVARDMAAACSLDLDEAIQQVSEGMRQYEPDRLRELFDGLAESVWVAGQVIQAERETESPDD